MNEIEAYAKLTEILNNLQPYSIDLTLKRIELFLEKIGNPQKRFKSVIVGGTNGKGTLCQFISDALVDSGIKTGTYTSPHLISLNERFKINNKPASYATLLESAVFLKRFDNFNLTYFEFLTAMAFDIFSKKGVKIAVIEVGMGGEFDATNVVNPILSVITHISLDHTEHLGNTHKEITKTKSKIIKKIGVVGKNSKTVTDTIKENTDARLFFVDKHYINKANGMKILMEGTATKENLATALLSIDVLNNEYGLNLNVDALRNSFWPGRFEIINTLGKTFILDGAHNKNATLKLISSLKEYKNMALIFSSLKSKSRQNNLTLLTPHFQKIILTRISNHKLSESVENMKKAIDKTKETVQTNGVNEAILYALNLKEKTVVVTGSLYLIGEFKACNINQTFMP